METITKTPEEITFTSKLNVSLANAIRRSVGEIPILAIVEADIYKNDSALYDEIIAHRLGLLPIKNQKMKAGESVEMKMKACQDTQGHQKLFSSRHPRHRLHHHRMDRQQTGGKR